MVSFPPTPSRSSSYKNKNTNASSSSLSSINASLSGADDEQFEREMALGNNALSSGNVRRGDKSGVRSASNASPLKSLTPKRIAIIAGIVLFCVFWFGRSSGSETYKSLKKTAGEGWKKVGAGGTPYEDLMLEDGANSQADGTGGPKGDQSGSVDIGDSLPPSSPQLQKGITAGGSSTCTPPPGQKPLTYALMMDAGSTGSRLHLYTFSHCDPTPGSLPKLESEGFFTTSPGLSSYAGKPREAAESLRGLMESAMEGVPVSERGCTPVALKATAGLRLLGQKESNAILEEVERFLKEDWPFSLVKDGVVIMDGRDEGVYAWITINFLLGLIGPGTSDPTSSAAIMDLGGASTQIVFEPSFSSKSSKLAPGDHVYDLDFAGSPHVLYQHSHLGYGLMQARRAVHNLVAFSYVWQSAPKGRPVVWEDLTTSDQVHNPCMFKGETKVVQLDPPGREAVEVTMLGTGAGFEACRRVVEVMLAKDAQCDTPPCAFGGVYQPSLGEVFSAGKVWALSYFYDRISPLGLPSPFKISALRTLTEDVCAGPKSPTWTRFKGNKEGLAELADRPEYCLDLTFMYSLLSLGYELDEEREIWMGKKVDAVELGWALGAGIAMVDGHLTCRAD